MPTYNVRFLRPDDSFGKSVDVELESDAACWGYLVENYPRKPCEIWSGDRLVVRRVSPAHDYRLRRNFSFVRVFSVEGLVDVGSLAGILAAHGYLPKEDFYHLERVASLIFARVRNILAPHQVWVRAIGDPLAPAVVDRSADFSFSLHTDAPDGYWSGYAKVSIESRERDGPEILNDLMDLLRAGFPKDLLIEQDGVSVHTDDGGRFGRSDLVRYGVFIHSIMNIRWRSGTRLRSSSWVERKRDE